MKVWIVPPSQDTILLATMNLIKGILCYMHVL